MLSVASAQGLSRWSTDAVALPGHAHKRRWLEAEAGTLGACLDSKISAGRDHTCSILDNGELKCWGGAHPARTATPGGQASGPSARVRGGGRVTQGPWRRGEDGVHSVAETRTFVV